MGIPNSGKMQGEFLVAGENDHLRIEPCGIKNTYDMCRSVL